MGVNIGVLSLLLDSCGFEEAGRLYKNLAFEHMKLAAAIATENKSMDELFNVVMSATAIECKDGEVYAWLRSIVGGWSKDSQYRKDAEELIGRAVARMDGGELEGDIRATPRQIIFRFLTSADIDPTQEPWASLVELAVKDGDPTRILIGCKHKVVMRHPFGYSMLDRFGLEWANPKSIGCGLHQYALSGPELDDIDREFNARFCEACPDKDPHSSNWTFEEDQI